MSPKQYISLLENRAANYRRFIPGWPALWQTFAREAAELRKPKVATEASMIYRHPDNSFRRYPYRETEEVLTPIPDRPGWFTSNKSPIPVYREPGKPSTEVIVLP